MNEIGKLYHRPWGTYQTLALDEGYQVKLITVNPAGRLSLQKHAHRAERWIVVKGHPIITVGNSSKEYQAGDMMAIEPGVVHRLENFTPTSVIIAEVQLGSYLGEDDIIRLEDSYGRTCS